MSVVTEHVTVVVPGVGHSTLHDPGLSKLHPYVGCTEERLGSQRVQRRDPVSGKHGGLSLDQFTGQ